MGVLNVTPDSFSDGGRFFAFEAALDQARAMAAAGADIIDIGGESSRPGAGSITAEEELRRVVPIIEILRRELSIPVSIDTCKSQVAERALLAGAAILNDITGLVNPQMRAVAARFGVPVVIMHMQGTPRTMQQHPRYTNVVSEVREFFEQQIRLCRAEGIHHLILDPGIGFGKTVEHNLSLLKHLRSFAEFGFPILIGPSRKSFIGTLTGLPTDERLPGTIAAAVVGAQNGATIIRVHDVAECRAALTVADAIANAV